MKILFKNEFLKLKREKFIWFLLALNLLPIIMNIINYIVNGKDSNIKDVYFIFYNQYFMFFPIIVCILVSSVFYIEYKNGTYLNWITYNFSKSKLFWSKIITSAFCLFLLVALNYILILIYGVVIDWGKENFIQNIIDITFSYFIMTFSLSVPILLLSTIVIVWSKNIVIASIISIVFSLFSMILIAAPFAYTIFSTFSYRLGLYIIDKDYYFDNTMSATIVGSIVWCSTILILYCLYLFFTSRKLIIEK